MEDDCDLKSKTVKLTLPEQPYDYNNVTNSGVVLFTGVDNHKATLGRVLFYDTYLSKNNSISCGSCHKQAIGFSDDATFSLGFENHTTSRNTLPIQNVTNTGSFAFSNPSLFWDGRANFLPTMVLMPMLNHVEMGMSDMNEIVEKVKSRPYYNNLFANAYGTVDIDIQNIADALSSFVSSIFSANTRFDFERNGMANFNALEQEGMNLFFTKYDCNSCHKTDQLNGYEMGGGFVNIGLDQVYSDKGLENVTNLAADNGKFKIPNLRNIALTGPFMHDGRFNSLEKVLDHYSTGIANSSALDVRLKDDQGNPKKMNITQHEKKALLAFLNTLTDYTMITDPKFSNPFKVQ
jgi:cytochrome c peroxidase